MMQTIILSECMVNLHMGFRHDTGEYRCILTVQTMAESKPPKSVKFEYLTEDGEWAEIKDAKGLGCDQDTYNTTELGNSQNKRNPHGNDTTDTGQRD